jgi:aryl-alcohol dehydrogenase-like predicted oxidoreductase
MLWVLSDPRMCGKVFLHFQQQEFSLQILGLLSRNRYAEAESRYGPKPNVREAVAAYAQLAQQHGSTPTAMALR